MALEAWFIPHPQPTGIVLMFHGYGAGKSCLLTEAQVFHQLGFSTFLSDFRGSGGSGGNQTSLGWHEADDVTAAVDAVRALSPARPIILYGQSMGAAAILRAISVNGLQPDGVILESVFDRMLNTVKNRFRSMGIPSFPSAQLIVLWGGVQTRSRGFANNPVEYAKAVRCPVLMLHGANDPRATPTQARTVFDNLGGRKHIEIFEGVGHQSCLPANPEKWKNAVSKFLALCHGPMRNASEGPK
jgi:alpha-beta hydrolase superfamily lysophospholipase